MKKIILPRGKIEQWVEHMQLEKLVRGAFARVSYSGTYRLAEIVGVKEEPGKEYELAKVKTSYQLVLKAGKTARQFKISLVSNQEPTQFEFEDML